MRFTKTLFLSAVLGLAGLPMIANATLYISNNTAYDSAVKISGICSGPTSVTPHGAQHVPYDGGLVSLLCLGANPCSAEVYLTPDCSDRDIGSVSVDTSTDNVNSASFSGGYSLGGLGSNDVSLNG